jgi:hypothetical protein
VRSSSLVNRRGARISDVGEFLRQHCLGVAITAGSFGWYVRLIDLPNLPSQDWSTSQRHQSPWAKTTLMSWIFWIGSWAGSRVCETSLLGLLTPSVVGREKEDSVTPNPAMRIAVMAMT